MSYQRLSPQDALFLHLENEHQPMHVGSLAYLEGAPFFGDDDGPFRLDAVRERIGSRLHLVPRFRKRIMEVPFNQGRPVWVDDEDFDLSYHVRLTALPRPGTEQQLLGLMERLQAVQLDRRRPLWEIWFVEGVEGDRVGIIQKTHHCLIDGVSGIDVATVLLDLEPDPPPIEVPEWKVEPPPEPGALLVESLVERVVEPTELLRSVRAAVRLPQQAGEMLTGGHLGGLLDTVVEAGGEHLAGLVSSAREVGGGRPDTPLNVPITPHRRMELVRVPLERVKAIKQAAGCTINDVVLTACSMALGSFLQHRDALEPGMVLKAMVPVSVRDESEQMALGNRVSMLVAELPVSEPDPLEQLEFVSSRMRAAKSSGQQVGADALVALAGFAPSTLLSLAARLAPRALPVNTVITNIPGPQFPLYCMGARVLEAFPYVNMIDGLALIMAVISYDGQLSFGVSSDRSAVPDVDLVARSLGEAFDELAAALQLDAPAPVARKERPAGKKAVRKKPVRKKPAGKKAASTKASSARASSTKAAS